MTQKSTLRRLVLVVLLLGVLGGGRAAVAVGTDVRMEADWILSLQLTSGPDIGLIQNGVGQTTMAPYFSNAAASGLAAATLATGDPKYVNGAWSWLKWYAAHMNANGFVTNYALISGNWVSTNNEDSTDGYAGSFLKAVFDAYNANNDSTQLGALWPAVGKAVNAMLATSDGHFMTYAKPNYPQLFLMDNVEVYEGFRSVEYLAGTPHPDPALRKTAVTWAAGMKNRFEIFWDAAQNGYDVAIGFDGIRFAVDWHTLYPAVTAQAWILRTGVVPAARAQALAQHINGSFPAWDASGSQSGQSWWPEIINAMRFAGDSARAQTGLTTMTSAVVSSNRAWPYHVGNAGRIIEQLIGLPETAVIDAPPAYSQPGTFSINVVGVPSIGLGGAVTFECSLDSAVFVACAQPLSITSTTTGVHSIQVRSVDSSAKVDPVPVALTWTIDSAPPVPSFTSVPAEPGNALPVFSFTATDDYSLPSMITFECATDGSAYAACSSPATLPITGTGTHTMSLRATDAAGNVSAPIVRTWFADATPPTTSITSGPSGTVGSTTATFSFNGTDDYSGVSFECRVGLASAFKPCSSPASFTVGSGTWAFQVRAVDGVGNPDPHPPTRNWNVDLTPPTTLLLSAPSLFTSANGARFEFGARDDVASGLTFTCSLDSAAFSPCVSPMVYRGLSEGRHRFAVIATDGIGLQDPSPPSFDWTVDATPPSGSISTPDAALLVDLPPFLSKNVQGTAKDALSGIDAVTVRFSDGPGISAYWVDIPAEVTCANASRTTCTWSARANLKSGRYSVTATVTDRAGNVVQAAPPVSVEVASL